MAAAPHARARDLAGEIDAIRADRAPQRPASRRRRRAALESALARGERGALVHGWLAMLSDAVGCERQDRAACDTFAAACSVRLAG